MSFYQHWQEKIHASTAPKDQASTQDIDPSEASECASASPMPFVFGRHGEMTPAEHIMHHALHGFGSRRCSLAELPNGVKARVVDFSGAPQERGRLCSMGLTPGTEIEGSGSGHGQRRFRVRNCSYALDKEVATRITCSLTDCWPEGLDTLDALDDLGSQSSQAEPENVSE